MFLEFIKLHNQAEITKIKQIFSLLSKKKKPNYYHNSYKQISQLIFNNNLYPLNQPQSALFISQKAKSPQIHQPKSS